jgi:hypothetical protein
MINTDHPRHSLFGLNLPFVTKPQIALDRLPELIMPSNNPIGESKLS